MLKKPALTNEAIKSLPWCFDRAILLAHTSRSKNGFNIGKYKKDTVDSNDLDPLMNKNDVIGCHLQPGGIPQAYSITLLINKLKEIKEKKHGECCNDVEKIVIVSGLR